MTQAILAMGRAPLVQAIAMGTIAIALFVACALATLMLNLDRLADQWGQEMGIIAFFEEELDAAISQAAVKHIETWPEVLSVNQRSRTLALAELRETFSSDAELLIGVEDQMLPSTIELILKPEYRQDAHRSELAGRLKALDGFDEVAQIDYGADLMVRVRQVRQVMNIGGLVVAALVLLSVLFIISNTVRLTLFARRDEIEIMQLVGATNAFIRVPFYLEGFVQGCLGALFATLLTGSLVGIFEASATDFIETMLAGEVRLLGPSVLVTFVFAAGLIGVLASHIAVQRYLEAGQ